jgi:hypothetical protein
LEGIGLKRPNTALPILFDKLEVIVETREMFSFSESSLFSDKGFSVLWAIETIGNKYPEIVLPEVEKREKDGRKEMNMLAWDIRLHIRP